MHEDGPRNFKEAGIMSMYLTVKIDFFLVCSISYFVGVCVLNLCESCNCLCSISGLATQLSESVANGDSLVLQCSCKVIVL